MPTLKQLSVKRARRRKLHKDQTKALAGAPQRSGVCLRVYTASPKKPNSAVRKVAKVKLSTGREVTVAIPGQGHDLRMNSPILIRGGRMNDVPGVRYRIMRGKLGCDWMENIRRVNSRSKYGAPKPKLEE